MGWFVDGVICRWGGLSAPRPGSFTSREGLGTHCNDDVDNDNYDDDNNNNNNNLECIFSHF
jgi:hypothetical protein